MDSTREGLKSIAKVAVMPLVRGIGGIGLVWLDDGEFDCGVNSGWGPLISALTDLVWL